MEKVGIITYHSAYNFGSALQAYATQCAVEQLGFSAYIINYRMAEQKKYYSLYRKKFGKKNLLYDLSQISVHNKRLTRKNNFEQFFVKYFKLTKEFENPEEMQSVASGFESIISGSDQIWNKHSCELNWNEWKYMNPYLLKNLNCRKISYASSIGHMSDQELNYIIDDLAQFNMIAMREQISAEKISYLLKRNIETVLDPTFLLGKEQWIQYLNIKNGNNRDPFILYYSLGGFKEFFKRKKVLKKIAKMKKCHLHIVTPYFYYPMLNSDVVNHPEYGPIEFLNALHNAELVITDSYHGTILSANFEKEFFSICGEGGSEFRKTDIMKRLGLQDRVIYNIYDLINKTYSTIDYTKINEMKNELRMQSLDYLKRALT